MSRRQSTFGPYHPVAAPMVAWAGPSRPEAPEPHRDRDVPRVVAITLGITTPVAIAATSPSVAASAHEERAGSGGRLHAAATPLGAIGMIYARGDGMSTLSASSSAGRSCCS
jgi:hypothetical protein